MLAFGLRTCLRKDLGFLLVLLLKCLLIRSNVRLQVICQNYKIINSEHTAFSMEHAWNDCRSRLHALTLQIA